jgi:hypothetical protein
MSVMTHNGTRGSRNAAGRLAKASDMAFARKETRRHFWRRTQALVRRAYGPLIVYAVLAIALVAVMAIRVAAFVPKVWH